MKQIYMITCLFLSGLFYSQVGINTETPDASAMLDIVSASKGVTFPKVYLQSLTDTTTVPSPKESLIVFNTNASLIANEGYYYWNGSKWVFLISGNNDSLIENLTKFYTARDNVGYSFTYNGYSSDDFYGDNTNHSSIGDAIHSEWTVIDDLTTTITIDRAVNEQLYMISGMLQANNTANSGFISSSVGFFVDDVLVDIRPFVMEFQQADCTYREFSLMGNSKDLSVGNHTVKFAIRNRDGNLNSNTTITYGKKNPNSNCNNTLDDDETRMSASIFINQPFNF